MLTASLIASDAVRYRDAVFKDVEVQRDVVFRTAVNARGEKEALKLDIYQSTGDTAAERPAVLWFHGGGFRPGNDKSQSYIVTVATEFAKRGYVSVSADYRVSDVARPIMDVLKDAAEDGRSALAWVKAHAADLRIDSQRIVVGGGSAGGVVAISVVAVENAEARERGVPGIPALVNLWGSPIDGHMVGTIGPWFPPTITLQGTADYGYPHTLKFAASLERVGVKHTLHAVPDAPHTPTRHLPEIVGVSVRFVTDTLQLIGSESARTK